MQGELKSHSESQLGGKFVGDLHFTKAGVPVLIVGHHLMFGKEMVLEKPYALLEKVDGDNSRTDVAKTTEYSVKSIITRKIIFKTRPKPIVFT